MATAVSPKMPRPKNRRLMARNIAIGAAVLFAALLWWNWGSIKGQAELGAAYGAHVACSCRYIEGRDLKSCEGDFEAGMGMVSVSEDSDRQRVTASVPLLASTTAELRKGYGCVALTQEEADAD